MDCQADTAAASNVQQQQQTNDQLSGTVQSGQGQHDAGPRVDEEMVSQNSPESGHSTDSGFDTSPEERQHFFDIINTFRQYEDAMIRRIVKSQNFIDGMIPRHQVKLAPYREHLLKLKMAVSQNFKVITDIIGDVGTIFRNSFFEEEDPQHTLVTKPPSQLDTDRINSVLNQIMREWTTQGAEEREGCFRHILPALQRHVPKGPDTNVLVPGAGLGRLAYEIANLGYSCQGNEFNLIMLFVSNFILNKCKQANLHTFYPWALSHFCNNLTSAHQLTQLSFPDVNPSVLPADVNFSMSAGDFSEVYSKDQKQKWDCVVTCFFIDTAPNIVTYIETIADILKPNGIWINFGPLLYHFAETAQPSVEPSYEIVRQIIQSSDFEFVEEEVNIPSHYTRNPFSMLSYEYKSVYFVCRKR